jgi:heat shock protein HtpX
MNTIKTFLLMSAMMILFLLVGDLLGGRSGLMFAFIFSLAMNFGSYWFSDKIVLTMYRAREVNREEYPRLHAIVERLAQRANLPKPKIYVMNNPTPNAFATGRNPRHAAVAVTTGIMEMLDEEELEGVLSHELTHIKHRDILIGTIAATLVGTITFIARMAGWAMIFGGRDDEDGNGIANLILIILAPVIALLLQLAVSRSREFAADAGGAEISGKPLALASALEKLEYANKRIPMRNAGPSSAHMFIVNPLRAGTIAKLFSTHPPTEERIFRLREIAAGRR